MKFKRASVNCGLKSICPAVEIFKKPEKESPAVLNLTAAIKKLINPKPPIKQALPIVF